MSDQIEEARRVVRVNSKGKKTKRIKCRKGYKLSANGKTCAPQSGSEKATKRKSVKKAVRTKRASGSGKKKMATRKRLKAMRKRKSMNL
jgi:hypothetical protein